MGTPVGRSMGARIALARERAGLNKNQLARAVGTSWQHVDHWERDRTVPTSASLQRLATVLAVAPGWLLGGAPEPAGASSEALATFLRAYAPADITADEIAWLRAAPVEPGHASPGHYLDLLHGLRAPRRRSEVPAPPRTGRRAKVDLDSALAARRRSSR